MEWFINLLERKFEPLFASHEFTLWMAVMYISMGLLVLGTGGVFTLLALFSASALAFMLTVSFTLVIAFGLIAAGQAYLKIYNDL